MFRIQNVTTSPAQKQSLLLPNGELITISLQFVPMQLGWFIREIKYNNFILNGVRISNSPNLLYQYRNQIPFGLACFSDMTLREPTQQEDFQSGSAKLYILTEAEVNAYAEYLSGEA
jgi:hypothetical protein